VRYKGDRDNDAKKLTGRSVCEDVRRMKMAPVILVTLGAQRMQSVCYDKRRAANRITIMITGEACKVMPK
jgi:hypothetical protein